MSRFVLCRPRGGLNDTLCQLAACWLYAEKFERTLVIDTTTSWMKRPLHTYFRITHSACPVIGELDDETLSKLNTLSCYPREVAGVLDEYIPVCRGAEGVFDKKTDVQLTFDFTRDYQEDVVLHERYGGGALSLDCLTRIAFQPDISKHVMSRVDQLPRNRVGVHVRHTDIQTDYMSFFDRVKSMAGDDELLICSDNYSVVGAARDVLGEHRVVCSSIPPNLGGEAIHQFQDITHSDKHQLNLDMLTDLFALSLCSKLHIARLTSGGVSGFSRLAWMLHMNPKVRNQVIGNDDFSDSNDFVPARDLDRSLPIDVILNRPFKKLASVNTLYAVYCAYFSKHQDVFK
ncbi:MAG: nodulation protein NodZ [Pseudomonadota bacterium]